VQWLESFVTDDKIYCVYIAPNEEMIREHAAREVFRPIDLGGPVGHRSTTAEG